VGFFGLAATLRALRYFDLRWISGQAINVDGGSVLEA
jgi:hypothetical protein